MLVAASSHRRHRVHPNSKPIINKLELAGGEKKDTGRAGITVTGMDNANLS